MIRTRDPADCCVCCASRRYLLSHTSGSRRAIAGSRVISSSMRETNLISLRPHYSALFSVCHTDVFSCSEDVMLEFQSSATTVPCGRSGIKAAWQCQKTDLKSEPLPWIMPFFYFLLFTLQESRLARKMRDCGNARMSCSLTTISNYKKLPCCMKDLWGSDRVISLATFFRPLVVT